MEIKNISRRRFIEAMGILGGGLILGCNPTSSENTPLHTFNPNIFIQLTSDGKVTIVAARSEMGQGVRTSLTAAIADEMDADWDLVSIKQAPGDKIYGDQNTDASKSIRIRLTPMRQMGASARYMLMAAAAKIWETDISECSTENHHVVHQSGKKISYGDLAETAQVMDVPKDVKLKKPSEFKYIGKGLVSVDIEDFVSGKANYGIDVRIPNMKIAAIARCPVTFGTVKSFDKTKTMNTAGVEGVFEISRADKPFSPLGGLAVVASNTWSAFQGRDALEIEWETGKNSQYNSDDFLEKLSKTSDEKVKVAAEKGNVKKAFSNAAQIIESRFITNHLVHAPMETPNATAWVKEDGTCEVWAPTQAPQGARTQVAEFLGIDEAQVTINVTLLGGGFGRKAKHDFVLEAVAISKAAKAPIQVVWSREDDIQHSYYHACSAQYLKAAVDNSGVVTGWLHRTTFPPIISTFKPGEIYGADFETGMGATNISYEIANTRCENGPASAQVRIGWMRSVCNIFHAFTINIFCDEIAHKLGKDPLEHRLEMIGSDRVETSKAPHQFNSKRMKNVLKIATKKAGWGRTLPEGYGLGLALHYSFFSYVASVVEVEVKDGKVKVHKVFTAADCGLVVNPDTVKAQLEGAAVFGTSIALHGKISAKDGKIEQSNFHDYRVVRMNEAPEVFVELVESQEASTGIGEPGVPVIAPAIFNAVFNATQKRYYSFPLSM